MKKSNLPLILVFLFTMLLSYPIHAQDMQASDANQKKGFDSRRLLLDGEFGMWFGNETYINVSPKIGYWITDRFAPGLGITYIYYRIKGIDPNYGYHIDYRTHIYGGSMFARYRLFDNLFAQAEYEVINAEIPVWNGSSVEYQRLNIPAFLVGGGYLQQIGSSSGWYLLVMIDLLNQRNSIRANPVIRMGFTFGGG